VHRRHGARAATPSARQAPWSCPATPCGLILSEAPNQRGSTRECPLQVGRCDGPRRGRPARAAGRPERADSDRHLRRGWLPRKAGQRGLPGRVPLPRRKQVSPHLGRVRIENGARTLRTQPGRSIPTMLSSRPHPSGPVQVWSSCRLSRTAGPCYPYLGFGGSHGGSLPRSVRRSNTLAARVVGTEDQRRQCYV
jgi:hypothetical protein